MNKLPKIQLNWIFNGFRWSDKDRAFSKTYSRGNKHPNYHVILYKGSWSVHPEESKDIGSFSNKEEAINYAKQNAQKENSEVLIHDEHNRVETMWAYSFAACPQTHIFSPEQYPVENHPGEKVL